MVRPDQSGRWGDPAEIKAARAAYTAAFKAWRREDGSIRNTYSVGTPSKEALERAEEAAKQEQAAKHRLLYLIATHEALQSQPVAVACPREHQCAQLKRYNAGGWLKTDVAHVEKFHPEAVVSEASRTTWSNISMGSEPRT